ncbi:ComEC/Rec2 family competence protein [Sphaerotilus mobilis]|uniref:Metallo-beta-lactamase superfamily protein n=1 Tax=Sphaerotilus mobilis TaxID=47994 RepID=A0A4Q7LW28_9BURK|nr:MBL fold metallo-hydrolase [Sphaerotilus mobilis]RZS58592.1 metallo-beta-lactamase superfamily protein [Sphaerotilus mobilis]
MRTRPAITLDVLPASYGDALLLRCPVGRGTWTMLMDTGPDETWPALRRRLLLLPKRRDGTRWIDLLVISHIDHDHIGSVAKMLDDRELALTFGDVWFNAPPNLPRPRSAVEGAALARLLGSGRPGLPWNRAWSGQPVVTPAIGGGVQMGGKGLPTLTVLSPSPDRLTRLWPAWATELAKVARREAEAAAKAGPPAPDAALPQDLATLAARRSANDASLPNGSSIAFLLEHRGASVLLAADAVPGTLEPALRALLDRRGVARLAVDAVKLSHHASRANVTAALLAMLDSPNAIVSTDNKQFRHPDDEALARVITARSGQPLTLWFNHDTPRNRRWDAADLKAAHGHRTVYPAGPGVGVTVSLAGR